MQAKSMAKIHWRTRRAKTIRTRTMWRGWARSRNRRSWQLFLGRIQAWDIAWQSDISSAQSSWDALDNISQYHIKSHKVWEVKNGEDADEATADPWLQCSITFHNWEEEAIRFSESLRDLRDLRARLRCFEFRWRRWVTETWRHR